MTLSLPLPRTIPKSQHIKKNLKKFALAAWTEYALVYSFHPAIVEANSKTQFVYLNGFRK